MIKKQLIALAVAGLSITSIAHADEFLDNRFYAAPFGTYTMPDAERGVRDGWGGGLGVGKIINEHFNVELRGFYQQFGNYENKNRYPEVRGGEWEMAGGTADLQYHFMRKALMPYNVSPYGVVGIGGIHNWTPNTKNGAVSFITEAGIGLTYELADYLLLRTDVRYRYTNDLGANLRSKVDNHHDMVVNAGLVIPFGEKPKGAVKVEEPAPVAPPDCSTLDDDKDGVNNCDDKCPNTAPGEKVDERGCKVIVLKGVNFKYNSAILTPQARMILDRVAQDLIRSGDSKALEVQGHTSSEGTDEYNKRLSDNRARSVLNYLQARGVKNSLTSIGYGETRLLVSPDWDKNRKINKTLEPARMQNRRVELHWMQ